MTATLQPTAEPVDPDLSSDSGIPPRRDRPSDLPTPSDPSRQLRSQIADALAISLLVILGISGFRAAYGGTHYLLAGCVGVALGAAVALVGARRRWSAPTVALVSLVGFFVVGGSFTLPDPELGGLVPTPGNVVDLVDGATQGWARLITAHPPVGSRFNLLVVPYLCGLVSTVVGVSVAVRSRRPMWAALAPLSVLIVGILFGTSARPSAVALLTQGAVFAAVLIGWWSAVHRSRRRVDVGRRDGRRTVASVIVLLVAGVLAWGLGEGGLIPGMDARPRWVLRDLTEPPFRSEDYPSPLNAYRRYTNGGLFDGETANEDRDERPGWRNLELFEVRGLPDDRRLRLATLDSYDGTVFGVADGSGSSGHFERIGEDLPSPQTVVSVEGAARDVEHATVSIEVLPVEETGPYRDIWLPLPEGVERLQIETADPDRQEAVSNNVQYNLATGTAAVPERLEPGDRLVVDASIPSFDGSEENRAAWSTAPAPRSRPERLRLEAATSAARQLIEGTFCSEAASAPDGSTGADTTATPAPDGSAASDTVARTPYPLMQQIGAGLVECGAFSDGDSAASPSQPGHGAWRLNGMLAPSEDANARMVGNGEQYGPLAALLADTTGASTRVVMGFRSREESDAWRRDRAVAAHAEDVYTVTGSDVTTWIEVELDGVGWVPVHEIIPTQSQPQQRPKEKNPEPQNEPPPPPPSIPPAEEGEADAERFQQDVDEDDPSVVPMWVLKVVGVVLAPVALLAVLTAAIAGFKSRRRTRRRTRGPADARVAGGWDEIKDLAADLGQPVPARATRLEEAAFIGSDDVDRLARSADALVFGAGALGDSSVEDYWIQVDAARSSMVSTLSRLGRWKVLVNLASLRRPAGRPTRRRTDSNPLPSPALEGT